MSENTFDAKTLRGSRIMRIFYVTQFTLFFSFLHRIYLGDFDSVVIIFFAMAIISNVIWLTKKQRHDIAANLIILTITALMLLMIWLHDGIRDELLLTFPALVCFAILVGSQRLFKFVALIIGLNVIAIATVNETGLMVHEVSGSDYSSAVVVLTIMICVTYVIGILGTDLTKANKELNEYKASLEQKVRARTQELETSLEHLTAAQNELVESEKMASLGRMVAGISHEISTPIGIAVTATSHLQENNRNFINQMETQGVKKSQLTDLLNNNLQSSNLIHTNLERAHDLIGDFKNVSVLQSAQRRTQINLKQQIDSIFEAVKPKLLDRKIQAQSDCPEDLIVQHDPQALIQIITNLIMNTLHHGVSKGQQGNLSVNVRSENTEITLVYKDSGKGISKEVADNIFEPFYTTNRGKGGSGLGMHIVFNLVTYSLMGTIECRSHEGQGAEFVITFPANPE